MEKRDNAETERRAAACFRAMQPAFFSNLSQKAIAIKHWTSREMDTLLADNTLARRSPGLANQKTWPGHASDSLREPRARTRFVQLAVQRRQDVGCQRLEREDFMLVIALVSRSRQ